MRNRRAMSANDLLVSAAPSHQAFPSAACGGMGGAL